MVVNKRFIIWQKDLYFFLGANTGNPDHLALSGSQSEEMIRLILRSRGFSQIYIVTFVIMSTLYDLDLSTGV